MPDPKMSQIEFIKQLKARAPELKNYPDDEILTKVLERKPEIRDRIELNSDIANRISARYDKQGQSPVDWDAHPTARKFAEGASDMLPGIGAMVGGALSTPETLGTGTIPGMALGTGAGTGARDLIREYSGLGHTSPLAKAGNIGKDTTIAAMTPGILDALSNPIMETARMGAGALSKFENNFIPPSLRPFLKPDFLENFSKGGSKIDPILDRPSWQTKSPFADETVSEDLLHPLSTRTGANGPTVGPPDLPWKVNTPASRVPNPTGTGTAVVPPNGPIDINSILRDIPELNVPGATGTGADIRGIPSEAPTTPFGFKMNVPNAPAPPAPSSVVDQGAELVGNESRVARENWTKELLQFWEDKGYRPGGRDANGNFYMKKRMQ